jgi:hypothetical protein
MSQRHLDCYWQRCGDDMTARQQAVELGLGLTLDVPFLWMWSDIAREQR